MAVRVEFYGTVRLHAGVPETSLATIGGVIHLGEALAILSARFPELARCCLDGNRLGEGYLASIDGERFVAEPEEPIPDGHSLLLMSSDAGG